jgi:hypothetical protein
MEARFKKFVTIRNSYTRQGLSNHVTFTPINSGATVPLKVHKREKFFVSDFEFFTILQLVMLKY